MIEPRPADETVFDVLNRAKAAIENGDLASAILSYRQILQGDLTHALRGEALTNLGSALCLSARDSGRADASARLDESRELLTAALSHRPRREAPVAWATTRANLALVFLARYELFGASDDLMSAHMALDGTERPLLESGETSLHDWVVAIRDHLVDLRERRSRGRKPA